MCQSVIEDKVLLYQGHAVKLLHRMEALVLIDEQNMYDPLQIMFRDILTDIEHVLVARWSTPNKSGMGQHIFNVMAR